MNLEKDVALAIIAHEFAHAYFKHHRKFDTEEDPLLHELEADIQAEKWGFNVKKFREVFGEATVK